MPRFVNLDVSLELTRINDKISNNMMKCEVDDNGDPYTNEVLSSVPRTHLEVIGKKKINLGVIGRL